MTGERKRPSRCLRWRRTQEESTGHRLPPSVKHAARLLHAVLPTAPFTDGAQAQLPVASTQVSREGRCRPWMVGKLQVGKLRPRGQRGQDTVLVSPRPALGSSRCPRTVPSSPSVSASGGRGFSAGRALHASRCHLVRRMRKEFTHCDHSVRQAGAPHWPQLPLLILR